MSSPDANIPILSDKAYASSRWWVVRTIVFPSSLSCWIIPQIVLLVFGSIPEEGSSKNISSLSPIAAHAKHSFLLFPPERVSALLFTSVSRQHFCIISLTLIFKSALKNPLSLPKN